MTALLPLQRPGREPPAPAPAPVASRLTGLRRSWTLGVLCVSLLLVMGNVTALNTALADIARDTGATQVTLTWIVDSYTLVLAATLLVAGAIGDRYGRRGTLLVGLGLYLAGSAMPLLAGHAGWLVAWRSLGGLGAAFILPSTLSLITTLFPPEMRDRAVGVWAGTAAIGGALGIILAGVALEVSRWQAIFAGSAVLAALALGASFTLPTSSDPERVPIDTKGGLVSALAIGALVLGIIEGPTWGWSSVRTVGALAAGSVGVLVFVLVELGNEHPLLDVRLLKVRPFRAGTLAIFSTFVALFGFMFVIVQFLQFVRGYSPLRSGLAMVPIAVTLMPVSVGAPALTKRVGLRAVLALSSLFMAQALGLLILYRADSDFTEFVIAMLCIGFGLGLSMAPATEALVATVPDAKQGVASAVNDAAREIAAALGIAIAGSVLSSAYRNTFDHTQTHLPARLHNEAANSVSAALSIAGRHDGFLAGVARHAFTVAVHDSLGILLGLFALMGLAVFVVAPGMPATSGQRRWVPLLADRVRQLASASRPGRQRT